MPVNVKLEIKITFKGYMLYKSRWFLMACKNKLGKLAFLYGGEIVNWDSMYTEWNLWFWNLWRICVLS